jgi:hypothetical protein
VKDVPALLQSRLTQENVRSGTHAWLARYKAAHIDTGSVKPLFDMMAVTFGIAYVVAWPQEYKHYLHEQELKAAAAAGKH